MFTTSGEVINFYVAPQWVNDDNEAEGGREEEYMNLTVRAMANEKEYQFSWSTTKGPQIGEQQLHAWQKAATKITVFCSDLRPIPFGMDRTAKGDDGKPKMYVTPGTKLTVGENAMEVGVLTAFSAFAIEELSGTCRLRARRHTATTWRSGLRGGRGAISRASRRRARRPKSAKPKLPSARRAANVTA